MKACFLILLLALPLSAFGQTNVAPQLKLISPLDYQVFQREDRTSGRIVVETVIEAPGHAALTNLDRLEARLSDASATNDSAEWQPLPFDNRVRHFRAAIPAPAGGWYRVEVRIRSGEKVVATVTVDHVGVGEVFVVAGQSNSANHGEERQAAKSPMVVAYGNNMWQLARDPEPGASGTKGSFMPAFGDAMAARFQVPIGIIAIGVGSTSVREWLPKGDLLAAPPTTGANTILVAPGTWASTGALFDRIQAAADMAGTNGFRAILWHQGESDIRQAPDREISPAQYHDYLKRVIEASRAAAGWRVPWFVAEASYHSPTDRGSAELRAAQQTLVDQGIALAGPNTDDLGPEFREKNGKGIHFNARGLQRHGELWFGKVSPWLERQLEGTKPLHRD